MSPRPIVPPKPHRSNPYRDLALSIVAVLASAATVITCSAVGPPKMHNEPTPSNGVSDMASQISAASPSSSSLPSSLLSSSSASTPTSTPVSWTARWIAPGDLGGTPEGNHIPELPRFFDSLARLEAGQHDSHVRVVWIGDSHTQADGWTHAVRTALQSRFGNGGPGFIHVGWTTFGYRRDGVILRANGPWSLLPASLVSSTRVDDGVMGLGGLRVEARGVDAVASIAVSANDLPGMGSWDLAVRFTEADAGIVVMLDDVEHRLGPEPHTLGHISHVALQSKGPGGTLQVQHARLKPQLLGVVVEAADRRGVVLDTLGLNGARYRSALAWDEATWVAELARREPNLVILAFGSNESADPNPNYEAHSLQVKQLVGRVKKAAPQANCLIFGPVDRGGARYEEVVSRLNEAQASAAEELGCAFWNGQQAMGGPGSMQRWSTMVPRLGSGDRLHLTMRGYQALGEMLARDLLAGYDAGVVRVEKASSLDE